jgi:hypothetical protein
MWPKLPGTSITINNRNDVSESSSTIGLACGKDLRSGGLFGSSKPAFYSGGGFIGF